MLTPLVVGRAGTSDCEEAVAAYVFSATLAIQDITGLASSGVTASHVAKRLEGSAESRSYLFALSSRTAPRPLGELGYPALTTADLLDSEAWVFVSLPLLEDLAVIEAHVTLDAAIAPLPGEAIPSDPWNSALSLLDALSTALDRPIRQVWVTGQAPSCLNDFGYEPAFTEVQAVFGVPELPAGSCDVVADMAFSLADLAGLRGVLTSSSRHYPCGDLIMDTVDWNEARLRDAGARLLDRGGAQLTALARDDTGRVTGMAEVVHYDSDANNLCELGLIYVLPDHRRRGHGTRMIRSALAAARERWPKVDTAYLSYPAGDSAAEAVAASLGAREVSATTAWQKAGGS
ncbi:Mycothiol acetyltransferase [Corynebacterium capitovis DSM 44611]|uniref:GNAT family N-acetyltransferase n=1 Tax=Corynebacterium capitovis TaxID=131081 RepID=UPI00035CDE3D|nr:GNAT family N-acetyltransferase [Corynebacterium capitovis]WKD57506.1 Mycothiol acetyltransferase [Corynebacterium capitovis DSM 44611]